MSFHRRSRACRARRTSRHSTLHVFWCARDRMSGSNCSSHSLQRGLLIPCRCPISRPLPNYWLRRGSTWSRSRRRDHNLEVALVTAARWFRSGPPLKGGARPDTLTVASLRERPAPGQSHKTSNHKNTVPNLILDDHARKIAMERLTGQPIFAEPDGSFFRPGVIDLLDGDRTESPWLPSNDRTRGIVLGAEACKEIVFQAERIREPHHRGRVLKTMCVPVCSLMDVLQSLMHAFDKPEWRTAREAWPPHDQEFYLTIGRRLRKTHMKGPVRRVRHALGAHLGLEAAHGGVRIPADDLLSALGDSLILLMLMLHYPRAFSWIRPVGVLKDGGGRVVDTMNEYPLCLRWLTDMDGHVKDVGNIRLADDPLHELHPHIVNATASYNMMVRELRSSLGTIYHVPTEELRRNPAIAQSLTVEIRPSSQESAPQLGSVIETSRAPVPAVDNRTADLTISGLMADPRPPSPQQGSPSTSTPQSASPQRVGRHDGLRAFAGVDGLSASASAPVPAGFTVIHEMPAVPERGSVQVQAASTPSVTLSTTSLGTSATSQPSAISTSKKNE